MSRQNRIPNHFRRRHVLYAVAAMLLAASTGCYQNGRLVAGGSPWQPGAASAEGGQLAELERRARLLDDNNRQLHTQLAQAEQQAQVYREELNLVREQLAATADQLQDARLAAGEAQKQFSGLKASTQFRGGATLEPNTGLRRMAEGLSLGNVPVDIDGDVIRIRLASDQLFQARSAQLQPQAGSMLDQVAAAIAKTFPRQKVGIEGFTDSAPLYGGTYGSAHQLTAAQTMTVFDHLTRRSGLPPQQLFTMSQGSNYPRADNETAAGRAANRRVDIVIYPENF